MRAMTKPSTRAGGRRPKNTKAGNGGRWFCGGAACAMGILRLDPACGAWTGAIAGMGFGQSMGGRVGVNERPAR